MTRQVIDSPYHSGYLTDARFRHPGGSANARGSAGQSMDAYKLRAHSATGTFVMQVQVFLRHNKFFTGARESA